ncbi:MAG: pyrroline-5-carboxylate reductase [Firmicutes bacterium]|jgi:pyrroline-5-carboxylate reductase|nr:pyrroline-5-carboxylate reductase [Bacillota bacterium]
MLGFIGCGTMGSAILEGIVSKKLIEPEEVLIFDLDLGKTKELTNKLRVKVAPDLETLIRNTQIVFLCLKPQDMKGMLHSIKNFLSPNHLLVTIAAGLNIDFFERHLDNINPLKVIRIMPNTPCIVGEGMSVICKNKNVSGEEEKKIIALMESLGKVVALEEKMFSAVTGLSGSGPAYIFLIIEALADGGVEMGLSRDTALMLAAQTVLGSAKMFLQTGEHPAILKNKVTSPGGTTSSGLLALEKGAVRAALIDAVIKSAQKADLMGNEISEFREGDIS